MPKFVLIIGPQAVGKMTVGQELAKLTGYKLFYNHMTIEMLRLIFDYDQKTFRKMNDIVRTKVFEEFVKSNEKGIIFTSCFDFKYELDEDKAYYERWTKGFNKVCVVELEAELEERLKRNKTENRLKHKESKRNLEWSEKDLLASIQKHKFNSEPGQGEELFENYLKINNTNISAENVAQMIQSKFNL